MKKKIIISAFIIIALLLPFNFDWIYGFVLQSEKVAGYEISAMLACKSGKKVVQTETIKNEQISIPLPNGAVEFYNEAYPKRNGEKQYLIPVSSWMGYERQLTNTNFEFIEIMGSSKIIKSKDGKIFVHLNFQKFTLYFMRMHYYVTEITVK